MNKMINLTKVFVNCLAFRYAFAKKLFQWIDLKENLQIKNITATDLMVVEAVSSAIVVTMVTSIVVRLIVRIFRR